MELVDKFVAEVIPQLTVDQLEELIDTLMLELERPDRRAEKAVCLAQYRDEVEAGTKRQNELDNIKRAAKFEELQNNLIDMITDDGVNQRTILSNTCLLGYDDLEVKAELKALISQSKIIINEDGLYLRAI